MIDRDYEELRAPSRFLFITDGHSMESYAISEIALERFARLGLGRSPRASGRAGTAPGVLTASGADLLRRALAPAVELAAVRISLAALDPPLAPFARWDRYLSVDQNGLMTLRSALLLERVLKGQRRAQEFAAADDRRQRATERVTADPFRLVRGHDFFAIFHKLLQSPWGGRIAGTNVKAWSDERLARALIMALPSDHLDETPLFKQLRRKFTPQASSGAVNLVES